jgi:hypothetical protein
MALFEVAIIEKGKKNKEETSNDRLVFGPKAVIANDAQTAAIIAVTDDSFDIKSVDKQRMEVLIRPFA